MNIIQETMLLKILLFVVYLIQISLSLGPLNYIKERTGYLNQKDIIHLEEKEEISFIVIGDWGSRLDNQYQVDSIQAIQASYNVIFRQRACLHTWFCACVRACVVSQFLVQDMTTIN